jgi:uncharacterized protein (TIGR04255 family)
VANVRIEFLEAGVIHAVNILTGVQAVLADGVARVGAVIDVDSIVHCDCPPEDFSTSLPQLLDQLHEQNKGKFFACLSERALTQLEPSYE